MEESEDILPEDDSIFQDLSNRTDDISSDALMEGLSFEGPETSTPIKNKSKRRSEPESPNTSPRRSPRLSKVPTALESPNTSPRRSARLSKVPTSPAPVQRSVPASSLSIATSQTSQSKNLKTPASRAKAGSSARFKCPKCPSTLASKKTLDTHLRGHFMKGVTSRAPSLEALSSAMLKLMTSTLQSMGKEKVIGELSADICGYCNELLDIISDSSYCVVEELIQYLSQKFLDMCEGKKVLFPSAIRSSFYVGTNSLLCSPEFRETLKTHFRGLKDCGEGVLNAFIGNFMSELCAKVLVFVMKKMRNDTDKSNEEVVRKKRAADSVENVDFKQTVYHIAGSIMNGFLWKGKQYSKTSKTWEKYCTVMKEKCLVSESGENQCSEEVRHFSECKDRGGYKHINDETFSFFLTLFDMLMSLEGEHGSLPANVIDDKILSSDVLLCLWDVLVGSDLDQEQSLDLLIQVCQTSIKVVMKGFIKRRINQHLKKAYNSVALRSKLGST